MKDSPAHYERHFTNRTNWLRAAVLGANDGIISTTCIIIGVAAASPDRNSIVLAALAGLVAGACSMAAGEYVSVSSQTDIETGDLKREQREIDQFPEKETMELADIYRRRGLSDELSLEVARQLMDRDALGAHAHDELGINDMTKPNALQAAMASAASFISGGIMPFLVAIFAPVREMVFFQYGCAILFLAASGAAAAKMGGSPVGKSVMRICFWGTVAMVITALVGYIFGTTVV